LRLFVQFSAVGNDDLLAGLAASDSELLHFLDDVQTLDNLTENNVFAVQPLGLDGAEKELAAVGVGTGIGHGQNSGAGVLQLEVLIGKLLAVDGLSSSAVVVSEVTSLAHELGNDAMERAALVTKSLLAGAECPKVLRGLGDDVRAQLHHDPAQRSPISGNIHENFGM